MGSSFRVVRSIPQSHIAIAIGLGLAAIAAACFPNTIWLSIVSAAAASIWTLWTVSKSLPVSVFVETSDWQKREGEDCEMFFIEVLPHEHKRGNFPHVTIDLIESDGTKHIRCEPNEIYSYSDGKIEIEVSQKIQARIVIS